MATKLENQAVLKFETELPPCLICNENIYHQLPELELPLLPGCQGHVFVNRQSWSVFILKNLLKYPHNKIIELLENKGIVPSEWFLLCQQCSKIAKDAMLVFQKILKLEAKFETFQNEIKQKIEVSLQSQKLENVDVKEDAHEDIDTLHITKEIKNYFKGLLSIQECPKDAEYDSDELGNDDFVGKDHEECSNPTDDTNVIQPTKLSTKTRKTIGRPKGTNKYHCDRCNFKTFENKKALLKHHSEVHKKEEKLNKRRMKEKQALMSGFTCHLCPFQTKHQHVLDKHIKRHELYDDCKEVEGQLQCKYCDSLFPGLWALRRHMIKKHGNELDFRVHKCPNCEETFCQKHELNYHFTKVHTTQEFKFFCEICGFKTLRKSSFDIHLKNHGTEKSFICELCAAPFKTRARLNGHKFKFHNKKTTKNRKQVQTCKYCDANQESNKFLNKSLLNRHMQDVHRDLYVHKCDQCENSYLSVASLQLHRKINHSGQQGECQFCGVKVLNKVYLNAHYRACKEKPADFKYKFVKD